LAPGHPEETAPEHTGEACERISELLSRVGDKWTVLVIRVLGEGPMRFNALRRTIGDISQKMLASTLRTLERDGLVTRTVTPTTPPQVEYALTDLGCGLLGPVCQLAQWTTDNAARIEAARRDYAAREADARPAPAEPVALRRPLLHRHGARDFSRP
jgi:DNA-binding HxlR family transcriptional regulator